MKCRFVVFVVALLLTLAAAGCNKQIKPGDPLRGLNREQQDRFQRGRAVFNNVFTPETGLGPLFNAVSCGECHEEPAAGGFGDEVEVHATALRADHVCDPLTGEGGPVIQQSVTPALKAALGIDSEPFPKDRSTRPPHVQRLPSRFRARPRTPAARTCAKSWPIAAGRVAIRSPGVARPSPPM